MEGLFVVAMNVRTWVRDLSGFDNLRTREALGG